MSAKNLQRVDESGIFSHIYNQGIESRTIFAEDTDYQVFIGYLQDYLSAPKALEKTKKDFTVNGRVFRGVPHMPKNYFNKVELIAYSLKPDHFHLILHQKTQKSLQAFIRSLCTRYSMYFNKKYNRTGSLFEGPYKSVLVKGKTSLLLLTHYLHKAGGYSSYPEYSGQRETSWVRTKVVLSIKNSKGNYKDYVQKYEPNQTEKRLLEKIVIEDVDRHLERRNPEEVSLKPWSRIPELIAASAVFLILIGLGIRNVSVSAKNSDFTSTTLGTNISSTSPSPEASPNLKKELKVKMSNATVSLNIRNQATTSANIIGKARDGDIFEFVSESSDWYEVILFDDSTGFLQSLYTEIVKNDLSND